MICLKVNNEKELQFDGASGRLFSLENGKNNKQIQSKPKKTLSLNLIKFFMKLLLKEIYTKKKQRLLSKVVC